MAMPRKNRIGERINRLVVIEFSHRDSCGAYWKCQCDCGNVKIIHNSNLRIGGTESCGCLHKEVHTFHGQADKSLEYTVWQNMKRRCDSPNHKDYKWYGARGIKVCDRWLEPKGQGFKNFLEDMGKLPTEKHTIERKDHNGNYEPSNCQWMETKLQNRNKRSNVIQSLEQANEIRALYAQGGHTCKSLALLYNSSEPNINKIINNKSWKNNP